MKRNWTLNICAFCLMAILVVSCGPVRLEMKVTQGQKLNYLHVMSADIHSNMMGMPIRAKQDMKVYLEQELVSIDSLGKRTISQKVNRISMEMKTGPIQMSFDTQNKDSESSPFVQTLRAMIGVPVIIVADKNGQILKVEGMDQVRKSITETPFMKMYMKQQGGFGLDALLDDSFFSGMVGATLIPLPPEKIKPGETWASKGSISYPRIGQLNYDVVLELAKVEENIAMITGTPKFSGDLFEEAGGIAIPGGYGNVVLDDIQMDDTYYFDIKKGALVRHEVTTDFEMELKDASFGSIPIQMHTTQLTTLEQ